MNDPILKISGLGKRYGDRRIFDNISFDVKHGQVVVIMGPSGSGKTTLLRAVNGLSEPDRGSVELDGVRVDYPLARSGRTALRTIRRNSAMIFQSFNLFPHRTALENVIEGLIHVKGMERAQAQSRGLELLAQMGLAERAHDYPARLSGGQKQRVAIARGLATEPSVMLFDEPTSALDPSLRADVLNAIRDLARSGVTMLIVTHESRFALDVADRIMFFSDGHVRADEPPSFYRGGGVQDQIRSFFE